mgnify:FL=1
MNKCKCGAVTYRNTECFNCTLNSEIRCAVKNISDEEVEKVKEIIDKYMGEAWDKGANTAANDIGKYE